MGRAELSPLLGRIHAMVNLECEETNRIRNLNSADRLPITGRTFGRRCSHMEFKIGPPGGNYGSQLWLLRNR